MTDYLTRNYEAFKTSEYQTARKELFIQQEVYREAKVKLDKIEDDLRFITAVYADNFKYARAHMCPYTNKPIAVQVYGLENGTIFSQGSQSWELGIKILKEAGREFPYSPTECKVIPYGR